MNLRTATVALSLLFALPAMAEDPHGAHGAHGGDHAAETTGHGGDHAPAHGDAHGAPHGDAHGEAGDHGGGHGGHHDPTEFYLGDNDGDGTANWMDSTPDGGEPRSAMDLFGDGDDAFMLPDIGFHLLHFFIFVTLLFFALRRPLGDAMKNRALNVRKELTEAARERDEARQKNEELVARLGRFERELEEMRANAATEAKRDADLLIERARAEAERIGETANRSINDEVRRAKAALRAESVDLAVQLAEAALTQSVQADDQRRLARQFLDTLTTGDSAHG